MSTQELINTFQPVIIQIATRKGTGSGFYLKEYDLIVTNYHVVEGNAEVMIGGRLFPQALSSVCFTNKTCDLAFILPPKDVEMPSVSLAPPDSLHDGDPVVAIGHPYGLSYTATSGIVSKASRLRDGLQYIQIDAAINPGNSGGPLVDAEGRIVGINSFIIQGGDNLGFALPVPYLLTDLNEYREYHGQAATRCASCGSIVTAETIDGKYCPECGAAVELSLISEQTQEAGTIAAIIERILEKLGKNPRLAARGPNTWEIQEGSATITVAYNQNNFVVGDALLCRLPKTGVATIYQYLLSENYNPEGLVFSINNQDIVLSAITYDEYFNEEIGYDMIRRIAQKADYYDTVLMEEYGALPRLSEVG
ncbi:MAG: serine protease [Chlorobi bacterium]|nr:serine protease [Chlorobiota bacterium]